MKSTISKTLLPLALTFGATEAMALGDIVLDFKQPVENIRMITDATERQAGLSHAYNGFQNSKNNKSHFFFTQLNPQPSGAAFASFVAGVDYDLSNSYSLCLTGKSLNEKNAIYQLIVETEESRTQGFSYKYNFDVVPSAEFEKDFYFGNFQAERRGRAYPEAPFLDTSKIESIGIRISGTPIQGDNGVRQKGLYGLQLLSLKSNCDG
ncbi:CIA30 family protein [Veronia pacifica]|uniref:NADH:ubiquinone oxidoreductase intermediate-associated protein 30 domain-containing protein n=1 Tax=Veronia pacifica TaxID=1080227 RepID=A0A1C3ESU4_9GAMM|nr:CIA30 family protein [Veronia pacifica]ODA36255.1 hypothetical protein A8L45_01250 [Veronia pacifica]